MREMLELNSLQEAADRQSTRIRESLLKAFPAPMMLELNRFQEDADRIRQSALYAFTAICHTPPMKGKVGHIAGRAPVIKHDNPPGKMPNIAICKLAINAAWQIECETGRPARAVEVIKKLQSWVEQEDVLLEKFKGGVLWQTNLGNPKEFDIEACSKALRRWRKTCP